MEKAHVGCLVVSDASSIKGAVFLKRVGQVSCVNLTFLTYGRIHTLVTNIKKVGSSCTADIKVKGSLWNLSRLINLCYD